MNKRFLLVLIAATLCTAGAYAEDSRKTLAVLPFETRNVDAATMDTVTDAVTSKLDEKNVYVLVERAKIERVLKEQAFQLTGLVDDSKSIRIGKLVGAQKLLQGSLNRSDNAYILSAKIVDVETGVIDRSWTETSKNVLKLETAVSDLVDNLVSDREMAMPKVHFYNRKESVGVYVSYNQPHITFSAGENTFETGNKVSYPSYTPGSLIGLGCSYAVFPRWILGIHAVSGYSSTLHYTITGNAGGINFVNRFNLNVQVNPTYSLGLQYALPVTENLKCRAGGGLFMSSIHAETPGTSISYVYPGNSGNTVFSGDTKDVSINGQFACIQAEYLFKRRLGISVGANYLIADAPHIAFGLQPFFGGSSSTTMVPGEPKLAQLVTTIALSFYF